MFCVGITGGIGTGKTIVSKIFSSFGIPIYNADDKAKYIVNTDIKLKQKIINLLGQESYTDSKYNTIFVAQKVFSDKILLDKLNGIIHPAVFEHFEQWKKNYHNNAPYLIKEASILFESGSHKNLNFIIGLFSPKEIRIQRLTQFRHLSEEEIIKRMNSQLPEEEKLQLCDAIIYNNSERLLLPQVLELHNKILDKL